MIKFLKNYKIIAKTVLAMIIFSVIFSFILSFFYLKTEPVILKSEMEAKKRLLLQVLPSNIYNNDLVNSYIVIPPNALLKNKIDSKLYLAKQNDKTTAVIIETTAPDGYSGEIKLLVGINRNGEFLGTRVIKHQETPGLGDYIDIKKDSWITIFKSISLDNTPKRDWAVKKDYGKFDYMAGATITPRAVIKAIYNSLIFFNTHKIELGINV